MKNATIKTIYAILTGSNNNEADRLAVIRELEDDFAREQEKQNAKLDLYETMHSIVFSKLGDAPMTLADLWAACEAEMPDEATKNKLSYALRNYWADEVVVVKGKVNEYRRK